MEASMTKLVPDGLQMMRGWRPIDARGDLRGHKLNAVETIFFTGKG